MAANFRIERQREKNHLHLNLIGDFDGSSAMELIHVLREQSRTAEKIFVHTCKLSSMAPFGQTLFRVQYRISGKAGKNLVFTGKFSDQIGPEKGMPSV